MTDATSAVAETIALFSDGTGNSSAKLFKTNVWRMYQAVDPGPNRNGNPVQVAYYDNGIGTQSIKALAALAGIFGIGLKPNVLRLYRFACRNGTGNCQFFCFGFSRGAFTIRLVAAMLAKYGVVEYESEKELELRTLDTFRDFMRDNDPNVAFFIGRIGRWFRDRWIVFSRAVRRSTLKGPTIYRPAKIRFVGVWDTVAAYGGPIAEMTRGVDDYIWPLTMTDSCLHENVEIARHALALDDERDAFWPVLWDEVDWADKAVKAHPGDPRKQAAFRERLKQVWFAGMHSDVGGGYPDESLSYVSLVWMMGEAERAGLRLLPEQKKLVSDMANSLGPIHNSRGGLGVYYRPQPRKIAAFLDPKSGMNYETSTLTLRDPVLGELPKPPHGVLLGCRVHESVIARLVEGTDDYAPAGLPAQISVEPYFPKAKNGGNSIVPQLIIDQLSKRDDAWYAHQEGIWDYVLFRRVVYFATVLLTFALVAMPLWAEIWLWPKGEYWRTVLQRLTSWSKYVPVDWLRPWIRAFEINPFVFLGLFLLAIAGSGAGGYFQEKAISKSYILWRQRIGGKVPKFEKLGWFTRAWRSVYYQAPMQFGKWRVLPALAALVIVLSTVWIGSAGITQAMWALREPTLCSGPMPATNEIYFETNNLCAPFARVKRGHRYEIVIEVADQWFDASVPASPIRSSAEGDKQPLISAGRMAQAWGTPYKRLLGGRYFQPIVKLHPDETPGEVPRTVTRLLKPVGKDGTYIAIFDAEETGDLFFFLNDVAFIDNRDFYENNCGSAWIKITDLDATEGGRQEKPPVKPERRCDEEHKPKHGRA